MLMFYANLPELVRTVPPYLVLFIVCTRSLQKPFEKALIKRSRLETYSPKPGILTLSKTKFVLKQTLPLCKCYFWNGSLRKINIATENVVAL